MVSDSFDRIVKYFEAVTINPFTYKGKQFNPTVLHVSPSLLKDFTCPSNCGACCQVVCPSLDYLPGEALSPNATSRVVLFNKGKEIFTDLQLEASSHCGFLNLKNGRCLIYQQRPFLCDIELIKVIRYKSHFRLGQQQFGRSWRMTRVDGGKGPLCKFFPSENGIKEASRKLQRLKDWMIYFELDPKRLDLILDNIHLLASGQSMVFDTTQKGRGYK